MTGVCQPIGNKFAVTDPHSSASVVRPGLSVLVFVSSEAERMIEW